MKQAFGVDVPQTLEDVCNPRHLALLVYDMQVGIKSQVKDGEAIASPPKYERSLKPPGPPKYVCSSRGICPCPKSLWAHSNFVWR